MYYCLANVCLYMPMRGTYSKWHPTSKTSFFPKALVDDLSAAQNYLADEIFRNFISDSNLRCKNVGQ